MPLKLKWRKKKAKEGDGDSASIASGASYRSEEGEVQDAYVIAKEKDLPKLHRAVWKGDLTKVKQLTKNAKERELNARDKEDRTALHLACARGHGRIIIHFCAQKVNTNVVDSDGRTPMHKVLESGRAVCLKYLLDCGGNANMADKRGYTPLHVAAQLGNVEAATLLLERDARIDAVEKDGRTALHLATLEGHYSMASSLINDGADVNATDGQGRTALMLAARDGRLSLVKLLTESKADPEVKDNQRFKALDYAVTQNHLDCARLIEDHERQVAKETLRLKQQPPQRTSLVDTSLISSVFGLGAPPVDHSMDDVPSKSEETLSHASQSQQDSWPASDTDDDDLGLSTKPAVGSKVNLRAGLERAKAVSPGKEPEIAPKLPPPDLLVTQPSDTALPQQEEEATSLLTDKPSPSDPLHYQLSTTAAGKADTRPPPTEPEDQSISSASEWDSDDEASLPLSSPNSPVPLTKLEPGSTPAITGPLSPTGGLPEPSLPASNAESRPREQLLTETTTKLQEDKTQPDAEEEEEEEEEEEVEVEVSDFDSDFSLEGDLPDFGGYEPSTSSDVGRSELLRRRSSTSLHDKSSSSLHDKGSAALIAAPKEAPATLTSPESTAVAVTPLSSTAFTPDGGSINLEKSPFGALKERFDSGDGEELSKDVEKVLSFSEQREETGVEEQQKKGLQGGKEKRLKDEFDDSDWDSKEEEEEEEDLSESVQVTSRQVDSLPEPKVTPPTQPKVDYFSYYDSDSEGEDEIEKAVMPPSAPPPPTATAAGAEEVKEKLDKDHAPVSPLAGESPLGGTHDTSHNEQKVPATLEQSASSEESESESEWEEDQRLKRRRLTELQPSSRLTALSGETDVSRPDIPHEKLATSPPPTIPTSPPTETLSAENNELRLQGSLEEASAIIVSSESAPGNTDKVPLRSSEGEGGRKHRGARRGTTAVTTDDLNAARRKIEDEASQRFHDMQNELQTLLKSRGKWTDNTWVSPRHKAKEDSEESHLPGGIQLPSLSAPMIRTGVSEPETKDSGITSLEQGSQPSGEGGVVLRGKSRVQFMKEVWESKLPFAQTETDEIPGDRPAVCDTQEQDSPSPPVSSWLEPQNTVQRDGPNQDTAPDVLPEVKAPTEPAALISSGKSPRDQKDNLEDSEEEILELLSEGEGEGEEEEGKEVEREEKRERDIGEEGREVGVEAGGLLPLETKALEYVPGGRTTENNVLATKLPESSQVTPKVQKQPKPSSGLPNPGDRSTPVTKVDTTPAQRPRPAIQPLSSQTSGDDDVTSTESDLSHISTPHPLTSTLTHSHLDSSPLRLHHLGLTPSLITPHNHSGRQPAKVQLGKKLSALESHDQPSESHDQPSESHDLPSESHDFSDTSHLDDLPLSPLLHLNQSGGGGASLLSSAHVVQMQESLREARRGLERSLDAQAASERTRRQLEAQLEETRKKYDDVFRAKLKLENAKLDLELQLRELHYQLEQEREGRHSSEVVGAQLREQLERAEGKVSQTMEGRQAAELRRRELEIEHRSFKISNQQLQDEVANLTMQLKKERDTRGLQEGLYKEQIKMLQSLQEESHKAQQQKFEALSQLQTIDSTKQGLEEKLTELQRTNTQLQVELAGERHRAEDHVSRLEAEVETLKERLQERTESQVVAENGLLEARQQFEAHLSELRSKAELLSSHLEKEAAQRKSTEEEVSSLRDRLENVSSELQEEVRGRAEEQLQQREVAERAAQEKAALERDLSVARESVQQLQSRLHTLEGRASATEGEVKTQQALLLERTNQIAALQRELDHRNLRISTLEDSLRKEKDQSSKLEAQLSSATERLSSSQSDIVQLRQQVASAERRAEDKEASSLQTQEKFSAIFDSLRADHEKSKASLEERYCVLSEQLMSTKEALARSEVEANGHQQECERLRQELASMKEAHSELEETLQATEEAYHEVERERKDMETLAKETEEKVTVLEASLVEAGQRAQAQQQQVASLQQSLSHAQENTQSVQSEKSSIAEQKSQLQSEILSLQQRLSGLQEELRGGSAREEQLRGQVEHLSQIRSSLEATASQLKEEVVVVQEELEKTKTALERAEREAEEARGLWETEVKSRSKLGMRVLEMERSKGDVNTLVEAERKKTRKALELRKAAELKTDSLHEQNALLQRELGSLRSQLKTTKRRARELELNESQIPTLRAEFDREQSSLQGELSALQRQLEETQDQLRRESELRMKADQATSRARHELEATNTRASLGHSEVLSKQKEVQKLERQNRKLREELKALQDHIAANMVDKEEMEAYRKAAEERARQELNRKLEEVNAHLEHQSQAQEALERLRANSESEYRQKFERSSEELRMQLSQALADRQSLAAEGKRFKELYESELQRSEQLNRRLQRAKEEAAESKTRLSLEKNRTQHLLNTTQNTAAHLSSSSPHSFTTSTPLKLNLPGDPSPADDLLTSVRSELDKSIARHLDSVPSRDTGSTATRSTYRRAKGGGNLLPSKFTKHSHLDTIRQNYHI